MLSCSQLKGNCSVKKKKFIIRSIDRVCGTDAQEKNRCFTWLCKAEIQDFEKYVVLIVGAPI